MSKILQLWWFFLLLNILTYSVCGSSPKAGAGDFGISKRQKQPKFMYGVIKESSKSGNQRTFSGLNVVQHTRTSLRPRVVPVYGGAQNGNRRRRSSANSISTKSSLFRAAFRHLVLGLLLLVCF